MQPLFELRHGHLRDIKEFVNKVNSIYSRITFLSGIDDLVSILATYILKWEYELSKNIVGVTYIRQDEVALVYLALKKLRAAVRARLRKHDEKQAWAHAIRPVWGKLKWKIIKHDIWMFFH